MFHRQGRGHRSLVKVVVLRRYQVNAGRNSVQYRADFLVQLILRPPHLFTGSRGSRCFHSWKASISQRLHVGMVCTNVLKARMGDHLLSYTNGVVTNSRFQRRTWNDGVSGKSVRIICPGFRRLRGSVIEFRSGLSPLRKFHVLTCKEFQIVSRHG